MAMVMSLMDRWPSDDLTRLRPKKKERVLGFEKSYLMISSETMGSYPLVEIGALGREKNPANNTDFLTVYFETFLFSVQNQIDKLCQDFKLTN